MTDPHNFDRYAQHSFPWRRAADVWAFCAMVGVIAGLLVVAVLR